MDALLKILRPVESLINRQIRQKTPARELCSELEGKVVGVRVNNTGLAMYFRVGPDAISLQGDFDGEPDAVIAGSLLALTALTLPKAGDEAESAVRDGRLELSGDAEVAQAFQRLLQYGRPDLEEELSGVLGDVAAHGLGDLARNIGRWGRQAGATLSQNLSEYLQEESRAVPSRYEVDALRERTDTLRDDVARMEARLKRLESLDDR